MTYKYSYHVSDDFILDVLHIDETVFEPSARGTQDSLLDRYNANRESYILAYDSDKIVGYVAFFPINSELGNCIINENRPFDDNIQAKNILPSYDVAEDFDMFLISIAILPEYNGRGIGKELMKKYFDFISTKIQNGCKIRNTYSYAFTDAGARILSKSGFNEVKSVEYSGENTAVKLMQYKF